MKTIIRKATLSDVPRITKLINEAYRGETAKQGWTTEAELLGGLRTEDQELATLIEADRNAILVALDSTGDFHGCVYLRMKTPTLGYLGMLTVRYDGQARGWGSALLEEAERFVVREWKAERMEMQVISVREELLSWYFRRGYSLTGERRPFPHDDKFGIPLKGQLEFVVLEKSFV